jgi:hypothetical protein
MKKKMIRYLVALGIILIYSVGCNLIDLGIVGVPEVEQEKTNWCWAASMQSILAVYGTSVSQCDEANWLLSSNKCCNAGACDTTANGQRQLDVLNHWGLAGTLVPTTLTWEQLKTEIDAGRPVNIGFSWCSGGGHSLVIYGFSEVDGTPVTHNVGYMDPWFGEGYTVAEYDWVVGGCPGDHTWYRTIYNIHK